VETPQRSKKKVALFWGLILIPVGIAVFFYLDSEQRYYESFRYDMQADYEYSFPKSSASPVTLGENGFQWPLSKAGADTAFLKITIRSDWTSILFLPYVEIRYHGVVLKQYFEKTGRGIRYLNLSPLLKAVPSLTGGEKLVIKKHHISWDQGASELYLFQNFEPKKARILILAPHPDDAEIAAFGLYNDQDAYIITVTAGEGGKAKYQRFFKNPKKHALFQGKIRTWDSIVVPFWGGISPQKCFNLGYFDSTLKAMASDPTRKTISENIGTSDLNTFRQYNLSDLLSKDTPSEATWNNLVADLEHLLIEINPSIIVTPNPVTDGHPDHQFTTLALLEALQRTPAIKGSLYLYTVHSAYATRWPLGTSKSIVSIPPFFSKLPFFEKIYSLQLSSDAFIKKFFAIDDMHDIRPVYYLSPRHLLAAWPTVLQSLYLFWKGAITTRKYLRREELFFVMPIERSSDLRVMFLKNLARED
jgi:LmbE family N-acetylglucosaminyl deacetylase